MLITAAAAEQYSCGMTPTNYLHFSTKTPAQKIEGNHTLNIRHEQSHGPQPLIDFVNRMHVVAKKPGHFTKNNLQVLFLLQYIKQRSQWACTLELNGFQIPYN